ncbi:MAG: hypothetical protein NWF02_02705 [Candidatus Bathyarchaeota archaeon]|nr:hypothetical protein [Candidatus Bathyarchaeum sp.]
MSYEQDPAFSEENELQILSEMALNSNKIDWKPAIILSELYIEKHAKIKIQKILKHRKIKLHKKIESLSLNQITLLLYTLHEINSKEYTEINKIQKAVKSIVHPKKTSTPTFSGDKANNKYKPLIEIATQIISTLKNN